MRAVLYTCEWCGTDVKTATDVGAVGPEGWVNRSGKALVQKESAAENRAWLEPVSRNLDLCSVICNNAAKEAEDEADEAARAAWVKAYQNKKV